MLFVRSVWDFRVLPQMLASLLTVLFDKGMLSKLQDRVLAGIAVTCITTTAFITFILPGTPKKVGLCRLLRDCSVTRNEQAQVSLGSVPFLLCFV